METGRKKKKVKTAADVFTGRDTEKRCNEALKLLAAALNNSVSPPAWTERGEQVLPWKS